MRGAHKRQELSRKSGSEERFLLNMTEEIYLPLKTTFRTWDGKEMKSINQKVFLCRTLSRDPKQQSFPTSGVAGLPQGRQRPLICEIWSVCHLDPCGSLRLMPSYLEIQEICTRSKLAHWLTGFWFKHSTFGDSGFVLMSASWEGGSAAQITETELKSRSRAAQKSPAYIYCIWQSHDTFSVTGNMSSEVQARRMPLPWALSVPPKCLSPKTIVGVMSYKRQSRVWWSREWPRAPLGWAAAKSANRAGVVPWTCHGLGVFLALLSTSSKTAYSHDNWWVGQLISGSHLLGTLIPSQEASIFTVTFQRCPHTPTRTSLAEPLLHSPIRTLSSFCTLELTPTIL